MESLGIGFIQTLLKEQHWETQANAAHLLGNLCISPEIRETILQQMDAVESVLSFLDSEKVILKRFALRSLSNLSLSEKGQKKIVEWKGTDKIASILDKLDHSDAQVVASACMVVVNLSPNVEINQFFMDRSLKDLLSLLSSPNFALQLYSLRAIFNLDRFQGTSFLRSFFLVFFLNLPSESNRARLVQAGIQNSLKPLTNSKSNDLKLVAEAFLSRIEKGIASKKDPSFSGDSTNIDRDFK